MIALAEQTALSWSEETSWGQASTTGFKSIPLITENLIGTHRQIRYQQLQSGHLGQKLILADEHANGEVELFPDIGMLRDIFKTVLMTNVTHHELSDIYATPSSNNSITLSSIFSKSWQADDILWLLDTQTNKGQWVTFKPDEDDSLSGTLIGSDETTITSGSDLRLRLRKLDPGVTSRSWTLQKQYGDDADGIQFTGMMIRRLELATTSDQMLRANISFTGKAMNILTTTPSKPDTPDVAEPLLLGSSDVKLILRQADGDEIDLTAQTDMSLMGFRLILEQSGLSPRYGLGSRYPDAMLGGQLLAYGTLDMIGSNPDVLSWFAEADPVQLFCQINMNDDIGFGFHIPNMLITEFTNAALVSGQPVHHQLHFDAAISTTQTTSLIHLYTS